MSRLPTMLALPVIPLSAFISLYRGSLIRQRRTREVTYGVLVNAAILVSALFTGIKLLPCPSISITALSYSLAHAAEFFFLASLRPLEAAAMPTHS